MAKSFLFNPKGLKVSQGPGLAGQAEGLSSVLAHSVAILSAEPRPE